MGNPHLLFCLFFPSVVRWKMIFTNFSCEKLRTRLKREKFKRNDLTKVIICMHHQFMMMMMKRKRKSINVPNRVILLALFSSSTFFFLFAWNGWMNRQIICVPICCLCTCFPLHTVSLVHIAEHNPTRVAYQIFTCSEKTRNCLWHKVDNQQP